MNLNGLTSKGKKNKHDMLKFFKSCSRYIDDVLMINNYDRMITCMSEIYPKELILVPDDSDGLHTY